MQNLLCQPFILGGISLKNRMVMPPMVVRYASADGFMTQRSIDYYTARARGGIGLIIQEATYIHQQGQILANEPGIGDDKFIPGLKDLTGAVHALGAKIAVQIVHGGRLSNLPAGTQLLAPSPIPVGGRAVPKEMTRADIDDVIKYFADAAVRAKKAGYDGIEVHAAHGYLIDQFISPASNLRKDEYAGSVANRARFLVDVIKAVKEATGSGFPVWCRMNGREYGIPNGETLEDAKVVAKMAEDAGAIAIHVSGYGPGSPVNLTAPTFAPAAIADLAAGIKSVVSVPVIAVGMMTPQAGEEVLSAAKADLIAFGRSLFADPDLPNKICAGKVKEVRPCILCARCVDDLRSGAVSGIRCSVNVATGQEASCQIMRAPKSKKVLVVGGGPAGMEAARIAAARGHRVSLWEKEAVLGGQLNPAAIAPNKSRLKALLPFFVTEMESLGVKVKTETNATPAKIKRFAPDAVVVATGVKPVVPEIPGLEKAHPVQAIDVLLGKAKVGDKVVIIGGEQVACEVAEWVAAKGKKVTMVRRGPKIATKVSAVLRPSLLERIKNAGINTLTGVTYQEVNDSGLVVKTQEGETRTIEADSIVIAAGAVSEHGLYQDIKDQVAESYLVGDAVSPRMLADAIAEGFQAGLRI